MSGKASNRKDIVDVIKKQKRDIKRAAGQVRAAATGISSSSGVVAGAKNQASGAGTDTPQGSDLLMHTYDIKDVDRLYFATTAGSTDSLATSDTGIESSSYYDSSSNTYVNFGLRYQVPGAVSGIAHSFRVGSVEVLDMDDNNIQLNRPLNLHSNTATGSYINGDMYYDGTDIKAVVPAGTVNLTSGGGGWVGTATSSLDMSDYDITTVDRLKFSATGTDNLATTDYGIATDSTNTDNLHYNVPSGKNHKFDVAGTQVLSVNGVSGVTAQIGLWVQGSLTATGNVNFNGDVDIGSSSSDNITIDGTPTFSAATSFNNDITLGTYGGGHEVNFNAMLDFRDHTSSTNQTVPTQSDGYIEVKISGLTKKLFYYS